MTTPDKKILYGGYNSLKGYKFMRKRVNDFYDFDDEEQPHRKTHKKKKVCKYNKGVHEFEIAESGFYSWSGKQWQTLKCKHCGKLKYT